MMKEETFDLQDRGDSGKQSRQTYLSAMIERT